MAFADYFQRNAMAASQLLQGLDFDGMKALLERHRIGLVVDGAADNAEGRAAADLAVRLIARFYPKIVLHAADRGAAEHAAELSKLAKAINPKISITTSLGSATHCLVVGKTPVVLKRKVARVIYVGSDNWLAKVSLKVPVGSGATSNPFGAGAAACLATANLFRIVFAGQLDAACMPDEELTLSLLSMNRKDKLRGRAYRGADVGQMFLVGAGAIGNGVLWSLGRAGVTGELNVIDPQDLDLGNPQRYAMTVRKDVGSAKVELASAWLAGAKGLTVKPQKKAWDDFARGSDWMFTRVLVALDTAEARIAVQASLPKWIVNAWTRESAIGISRHPTLNDGGCLACQYLPEGKAPSLDVLVASTFGFATEPQAPIPHPELMEIRQRLDRNVPCDRAFLERVATKKNVAIECLLPFENRTLRELYTEGVCGGQILGIVVSAQETLAEVPMAFQSALTGILLAAELVIDVQSLRAKPVLDETRINLMKPLNTYFSSTSGKDLAGRCLCQDSDFQARYAEKYG